MPQWTAAHAEAALVIESAVVIAEIALLLWELGWPARRASAVAVSANTLSFFGRQWVVLLAWILVLVFLASDPHTAE